MTCEDSASDVDPTRLNCLDAVEELHGFLDGEIDDEKRTLIRAHLDNCSPCLEAFDFEDELRRLVSGGCKSEMPQGLRDKVLAAIDELAQSND